MEVDGRSQERMEGGMVEIEGRSQGGCERGLVWVSCRRELGADFYSSSAAKNSYASRWEDGKVLW